MLEILGTHVLMKIGHMILYGEAQFDSQLLQLVNAWLVELWDDFEHN
jgi:hypothetical protein